MTEEAKGRKETQRAGRPFQPPGTERWSTGPPGLGGLSFLVGRPDSAPPRPRFPLLTPTSHKSRYWPVRSLTERVRPAHTQRKATIRMSASFCRAGGYPPIGESSRCQGKYTHRPFSAQTSHYVMAGLDPAISFQAADARIKSAHDVHLIVMAGPDPAIQVDLPRLWGRAGRS